mmetsp:Transcript_3406/g.7072  ORF Transcript_3406/g.7072 Transcript_3406/m.7072 type:complete len:238 (-) Transcript_3406:1498-2211(-)
MLVLEAHQLVLEIKLVLREVVDLVQVLHCHVVYLFLIIADGGIDILLQLPRLGLGIVLVGGKHLDPVFCAARIHVGLPQLGLHLGDLLDLGIGLVLGFVHPCHQVLHNVLILLLGIVCIFLRLFQQRLPRLHLLLQMTHVILGRALLGSLLLQLFLHPLVLLQNVFNFLHVLLLRVLHLGPHSIDAFVILLLRRLLLLLGLVQHPLRHLQLPLQVADLVLRQVVLVERLPRLLLPGI